MYMMYFFSKRGPKEVGLFPARIFWQGDEHKRSTGLLSGVSYVCPKTKGVSGFKT
jgi:hypothetical protein